MAGFEVITEEQSILAAHHPKVDHMHMWEAAGRTKHFSGWTEKQVEGLCQNLCEFLRSVHGSSFFNGFRFTIDLGAHRTWGSISNAPPAVRNLALGTFHRAMRWYLSTLPRKKLALPLALLFDRSEPYMNVVMQEWIKKRSPKTESVYWNLISTVAPVEMALNPGVQAADMLAWSINRKKSHGVNDWRGKLANAILNTIPHEWNEVEEEHIKATKFPGQPKRSRKSKP
jgi:hypothetical protein